MNYTYDRKIIHKDPFCEVVMIFWKKGESSPIHEHGDCAGMFMVLDGKIRETRYKKREGKVVYSKTMNYHAGQAAHEKKLGIHKLFSPNGAITIHVYSPEAQNKEIYVKTQHRLR